MSGGITNVKEGVVGHAGRNSGIGRRSAYAASTRGLSFPLLSRATTASHPPTCFWSIRDIPELSAFILVEKMEVWYALTKMFGTERWLVFS